MLRTPDGHGQLELIKFHTPPATTAEPNAPVNTLGIRRIMFSVDDIEDVLCPSPGLGAELVGEVVQYEDKYLLCSCAARKASSSHFQRSSPEAFEGGHNPDDNTRTSATRRPCRPNRPPGAERNRIRPRPLRIGTSACAGRRSLANSLKHAEASQVEVTLERSNGSMHISIRDDGRGFDKADSDGHGLANLSERLAALGGRLDVTTSPGQGTIVSALFALTEDGEG
jgi:Histidine kinase-, DNA gyrase B-, and HSP90-like ATPase